MKKCIEAKNDKIDDDKSSDESDEDDALADPKQSLDAKKKITSKGSCWRWCLIRLSNISSANDENIFLIDAILFVSLISFQGGQPNTQGGCAHYSVWRPFESCCAVVQRQNVRAVRSPAITNF